MKPDWEWDRIQLFNRDCLDVLPELASDSAIISDPPYGCNTDCDYTRFSGGKKPSNALRPIVGDSTTFNPSHLLRFPTVVLFGYQFFADKLPVGTILVWNKRRPGSLGKFLSDCELAWQKGGKGVYLFNHVWNGFDRASERGQKTLHPTQKPITVMEWVLTRAKIKPGQTVIDPYMGVGSTGLACIKSSFPFIGIETDTTYFETTIKRIEEAL